MAGNFAAFDDLSDAVVVSDAGGKVVYANAAFARLFGAAREDWIGRVAPDLVQAGADINWAANEAKDGRRILIGRRIPQGARSEDGEAHQTRLRALATASHEIRTPLNGILGMSGLLLDTHLEPSQRTYVNAIHESGSSLLALVNNVLDYSKLSAKAAHVDAAPFDLRALTQSVTELLSPRVVQKGIEIASYVDPATPQKLIGDEARLRQVLLNLAGNAVKFTERGGVLIEVHCVSVARDGGCRIRIDVRDTGVGISDAEIGSIFDEFAQSESGRAAGAEGTGLGLAIARKIISSMSGEISVESKPGAGSVFTVLLAMKSVEGAPARPPRLVRPSQPIVVATRSAIVRRFMHLQLKAAGASAIVDAGSSTQAMAMLQELSGPALICDLDIAVEGGPRLPAAAAASMVLLTLSTRGRVDALKRIGYDRYLLKPVRAVTLTAMLNEHAPPPPARRRSDGEPSEQRAARGRMRVLIAEDNRINALLTRTLIERDGHEASVAENGEQVVSALITAPFDIILMDMHMPTLDGLAATRKIRAMGGPGALTPIVALTAGNSDLDRRQAMEAGMDGFLTKPVDPAELAATLERWKDGRPLAKSA